jgi:hypothetical protein
MSEIDHSQEVVGDLRQSDGSRFAWPEIDRRSFLRRTALTGVAAGSVSTILSACGSGGTTSSNASGGGASGVFGSSKSYKFVFVNHVTTNPFFTPTQYGAADACKLLGCSYQWTGSESSNVSQMVNALNSAVTSGADGIAIALIDLHAFNAPVEAAIKAGIPVVAYNADAVSNARLAYIGQDLFKAGEEMGKRIVAAVGSGEVGLFIATPGSANLQPRIEGAEKAIKDSGKSITAHSVATGAAVTAGAVGDRSLVPRPQEREGDVRGRRWQHRKPRQSDAEARPAGQRRQGGWFRPHRTDPEAAAGREHRIHDRPAALPAGVHSNPAAVHVQGVGHSDRTCGNRHGPEVPRQDHRRSLRQHQEQI